MEIKHEIEVNVDGQPSLLTALARIDDNDSSLFVHDIFVGEIMMGTVSPSLNEHTGCVEWESDSDIPVDVIKQVGKAIERKNVDNKFK
jgi:hypothetical protein